jgi:hypothetical protein
MTTKLEEIFDLEPVNEASEVEDEMVLDEPEEQIDNSLVSTELLDQIDKVNAALPIVSGLEASDQEFDDIAKLAIDSYKDLMDLSMNVESRLVGEIAGAASNMLGHALTAKKNKIEKKLKMIDLQIRKMRVDQYASKSNETNEPSIAGTGTVIDRNELLKQIMGEVNQNKS